MAPVPESGGSTSASGGTGSNKTVTRIVIAVVILSAIGYVAQGFFARKFAEKTIESVYENATGGDVDVDSSGDGGVSINSGDDTIATGSKASWPTTMPSSVPEFSYGTIAYNSTTDNEDYKSWSVTYSAVSAGADSKYADDLTAKGWKKTDSVETSLMTNKTFELDGYRLNYTVDTSSAAATLTVYKI